jgi:hypothetical protein
MCEVFIYDVFVIGGIGAVSKLKMQIILEMIPNE